MGCLEEVNHKMGRGKQVGCYWVISARVGVSVEGLPALGLDCWSPKNLSTGLVRRGCSHGLGSWS